MPRQASVSTSKGTLSQREQTGIASKTNTLVTIVRSLTDIRSEIEKLTERRSELFHALGEKHDAALAAEHASVEAEIARLWEEHRIERARVRFGERDEIIQRARHEERLERAA
jgi:hypothetical protein